MQSAEGRVECFVFAELVTDAGDFGVEGFDADAELAGGLFSRTVVFNERKVSQSL